MWPPDECGADGECRQVYALPDLPDRTGDENTAEEEEEVISVIPLIYTVAELADAWKTTQDTILREIQRGKLTAFRVGVQWRVTEQAANDYMEAQACRKSDAAPVAMVTSSGTRNGSAGARPSLSPKVAAELSILEKPIKRRQKSGDKNS